MEEIETEYLVVGAGASAMAFVDALLDGPDARVVLVDRRHRPGGHWLNAYPFVRLHQPSAVYGVTSRPLGHDRIDESGPNAGFYERATAGEICDYYQQVLEERFLPSGRVSFLGLHDYRGADVDGHHVVSLLTGARTAIRARKVVDATYIESEIPSRHTPAFSAAPGVRLVAPNDLVELDEAPAGFTVIGAGKTAMDTCNWLLDAGVDPDRIQWIRPRDPWLLKRASFQPLQLVAAYMELQARWVEAAAEAESGQDFARRMEAAGVFERIDPNVEPEAYRGPIVSDRELAGLRKIERVVRKGRVQGIEPARIALDQGEISTQPDVVHVDCTAAGVRPAPARPVFANDRISLQYVTIVGAPWSAATVGVVEASREDDAEKNRLCPPTTFTGKASDLLEFSYAGMTGLYARTAEPDLAAWAEGCRLNPARGAMERADEPRITAAITSLMSNFGAALRNLARRAGEPAASPAGQR
jgi:NAD(P)-binding Rossmann-like domain